MGHALSSRRARLRIGGAVGILLLLAGSILIATGVAFAAVNCDSVFEGATPANPIVKTADKAQAYAGQTVTFTLTFTATGTADNVTADCYRVGDGSDDTLNALVTGLNAEQTNPNVGGKDAVQHVTYTITVPDDASLIGKKIVDRAKATSGSVESRSDLVEVLVLPAPCTPTETSTAPPTPTVAATQPTKVKGLTLGQTGASDRSTIWIGIVLIIAGLGLTGSTLRRRSIGR